MERLYVIKLVCTVLEAFMHTASNDLHKYMSYTQKAKWFVRGGDGQVWVGGSHNCSVMTNQHDTWMRQICN